MFLNERYQVNERMGRGSRSTVYRSYDTQMDRVVAIEVLEELYSNRACIVERFQDSAKTALGLSHPNIVQVYDYGRTNDNVYYIVRELVDGTDLRRYLRTRGILSNERAIIIAHDVALGLGAMHSRGIVQQEVSPQHIFIGRDGSIKIDISNGGFFSGPHYLDPGQTLGEDRNATSDIYGLGIVMYEMLTAHFPFDGDSPVAIAMQKIQEPLIPPSQFNPNISKELEDIILCCMEKKPENRYQDGTQLAQALAALPTDGNLR